MRPQLKKDNEQYCTQEPQPYTQGVTAFRVEVSSLYQIYKWHVSRVGT